MRNVFGRLFSVAGVALLGVAAPVAAQQAPPPPLAVPNPHYVSLPMEIAVNKPAAEVWKRIGKYCDIGEWLRIPCTITSGVDGAACDCPAPRTNRAGRIMLWIATVLVVSFLIFPYLVPVLFS